MKNKLLLLLIIILSLIAVIVIFSKSSNQEKQQSQDNSYTVTYLAQTDDKGKTVVEVIPQLLADGGKASFTVSLTAHSGDPVYDILTTAKLTDDKGKTYNAVSWTGNKGGHHVSGVLSFSEISKDTKSVTLTIPQIDKQDRIFNWKLN